MNATTCIPLARNRHTLRRPHGEQLQHGEYSSLRRLLCPPPHAQHRLCFLHNQVNARLVKPEFDCANLDATYDCGCGDEPLNAVAGVANDPMDLERDPSRDRSNAGLVKGGRALS